jgi:hypothetical protein
MSLYSDHCTLTLYLITMSKLFPEPANCSPRVRMSEALSAAEKAAEEVLIDLMTEKAMLMFEVIQASSTRIVQASPSNSHGAGPSCERRTKHKDDLANAKIILSILPAYLPALMDAINQYSVPKDFEYELVIAYLSKGIRTVCLDQDKITTLKFSNFNLGDRKVYEILTPHKYLTRTKGKNSNIIPQSWTMNLA